MILHLATGAGIVRAEFGGRGSPACPRQERERGRSLRLRLVR